MSTYVIANKQRDREPGIVSGSELPVSAIPAIFTDPKSAERYCGRLGDDFEITRLDAMQLLRWMIRIYEHGTHYLMVNPRTASPSDQEAQRQLAIEQQLARFAELLTRDVVACAESGRQDRQVAG